MLMFTIYKIKHTSRVVHENFVTALYLRFMTSRPESLFKNVFERDSSLVLWGALGNMEQNSKYNFNASFIDNFIFSSIYFCVH